MRHRLLAATAALALTLGAAAPAAATAPARYAALGDSYAAGTGGGAYDPASGDCHRGRHSYPALEADGAGDFRFAACYGATTQEVREGQLAGLPGDSTAVSVTVGGNDLGFGDMVVDCLQPFTTDAKCDRTLDEGARRLTEELPDRLDRTLTAIGRAAPNAVVAVTGYPHVLETGTDCAVGTPKRRSRIAELTDQLDELLAHQAEQHGFRFADPRPAFAGHGVCAVGGQEWINRFVLLTLWESFHPTAEGYRLGYLPSVAAALG
ncbi:hypothetical protein CFP65_1334 [Kitasatospora sp. MMS16-BH015]|uniref:SGNH/GDSL hydrolase family protein n=1 Tax=Kitasatospora sp. MMS16-BH015 TaxID=2018025 RepID=UPI000CA0A25D|nr:SGNH/GDSL hydrolase family protein [Kitasatospora sp. MMS16-BH015]AUG76233.1 hypothetical protein CFP65_1334 [Kitasatospora sp. MMS16-BH015]